MPILPPESVGLYFDRANMLHARDQTQLAVARIAQSVTKGMRESDVRTLAASVFNEMQSDRIWHPIIVRFGSNTLKTYRQASDGDPVLGADDIFFIDIGVVWQGHEGDAGDTFVVGEDPEKIACARAARDIFDLVALHWRTQQCSGIALYDYANQCAHEKGWRLNLDIKGHRVSDFPHAIYKAGDLGDFAACPNTGLWVLEIQIAHPQKPYGAFYEDLLIA